MPLRQESRRPGLCDAPGTCYHAKGGKALVHHGEQGAPCPCRARQYRRTGQTSGYYIYWHTGRQSIKLAGSCAVCLILPQMHFIRHMRFALP